MGEDPESGFPEVGDDIPSTPGQPVPEHLQLCSPSLQTTAHEGVGEEYPLCEHNTRPRPWAPGVSWHPPLHDILLDMSTGEKCQSQANGSSLVEDRFIPIEWFLFSSDFIPCLDLSKSDKDPNCGHSTYASSLLDLSGIEG